MALLLRNALRCGARRPSFWGPARAARLGGATAADYSSPFSFFSTTVSDNTPQEDNGGQVTVTRSAGGGRGEAPSRARRGRRGRISWRNPWDLVPSHLDDGVGNALMQASENLSRLLESWTPSRLLGRLKEDDRCYKLRYVVPGLRKEDLRVTVEDGVLTITGETEDEEVDEEEEETSTTESEWEGGSYARSYGYCNATLLLPDDAKADEITAELRDGVLRIWIPRQERKSNAREIEIK